MAEVGGKFVFIRKSPERTQKGFIIQGLMLDKVFLHFVLFLLWFMMCYSCCSQIYSRLQSVSVPVIKCGPLGKCKMLEMDSVGNVRSLLDVMCA